MFLAINTADIYMDVYSTTYIYLFPYFINPMKNIAVNTECFLIMTIALERLLAVWKPIRYRFGILRQSIWIHSIVFIIPPILLSILINIPKFFETEYLHYEVDGKWYFDYRITALRDDPRYIYYYIFWFRNIFTGVIPIIFLVMVNTAICIHLKTSRACSTTMTISFRRSLYSHSRCSTVSRESRDVAMVPLQEIFPTEAGNSSNQEMIRLRHPSIRVHRNHSSNSVMTLTSIVIMYVICNFPRLILNLFEHLLQDEMMNNIDKCGCKREPPWFTILCSISHFLLTFNSSANFIIYGSTEEKFKKTLKSLNNSLVHKAGNI